jgi:Ca2+-binding RTX toxin-like protein
MPTATVPGVGGAVIDIIHSSVTGQQLAQSLLQAIYTAFTNNTLFAQNYNGSSTPTVPSGYTGELLLIGLTDTVTVPAGYHTIVDAAAYQQTIQGAGGQTGEAFIGGPASFTYYTAAGESGTIVGGDGNNLITGPTASGGNWFINLGGLGVSTVAAGSSNDMIQTGTDLVFLDSGSDTVQSGGADTIVAGTGNDTVNLTGTGATVWGGSGNLLVQNTGGADTVSAGSGAETIFAAASGGLYFLNNSSSTLFIASGMTASTIVGGSGPATLFGGSGSNVMFQHSGSLVFDAQSSTSIVVSDPNSPSAQFFASNGGQVWLYGSNNGNQFVAGSGNVTLQGAGASGNNLYFAGSGADSMVAGAGADTMVASSGSATMAGGAGADQFDFIKGMTGGTDLIQDWDNADALNLFGYGNSPIVSQQVVNGSLVLTLNDNTKITFQGVTSLNPSQIHIV